MVAIYIIGLVTGYYMGLHAYKRGASMVDRLYHDKAPFDEDLTNEPLPSHTDGRYMDLEEE